jgi:histidine triad (HIT) family protein
MEKCPFCNIISGILAGTLLYQDEICTAIMDIQPINPGHMLIMPNLHLPDLASLPPETGKHLFAVGQKLAAALRQSGVECQGVNFLLADGKAAMQEVLHLHLHIIPRFEGDGFGFQFSPRYAELPTRDELEDIGFHIKKALEIEYKIPDEDSLLNDIGQANE